MTPVDRRALILRLAEQNGLLIDILPVDAASWREDWERIKSCLCHRLLPKRALPPRAMVPPREILEPGTWIAFRPHWNSLEQRCRVVAVVPPGIRIDDVLSPLQISLLERHTCLCASNRYTRVVVAIPGSRKSVSYLRPVLAGTLGARGKIIDPMEPGLRSDEPLSTGSLVYWEWSSRQSRNVYRGSVIAYIPAGTPVLDLLPSENLRLRGGTQMVSIQDRYAIRTIDRMIHFPPAFAVERCTHDRTSVSIPAPV